MSAKSTFKNNLDRLGAAKAAHAAGDLATAENAYLGMLDDDPRSADAHHLLGLIYKVRGKTVEAIRSIGTAIALKSDDPAYYSNLGACYLDRKEYAAAEGLLRRALDLRETFGEAWSNLGQALFGQDRLMEAEAALQRALELLPTHAISLTSLADLRVEQSRYEEALTLYEQALASSPGMIKALLGQGMMVFQTGRPADAIPLADQICAKYPQRAGDALVIKAQALVMLGRLDEALAVADEGLQLAPESISLLGTRVKVRKVREDDPLCARLDKFEIRLGEVSGMSQARLGYALGKAFDDIGDLPRAAKCYARGALAMRALKPYDEMQLKEVHEGMRTHCTADYLAGIAGTRRCDIRPIFILGMPRSGTTLIEQILAGHPDVYAAGELPFVSNVLVGAELVPGIQLGLNENRCCAESAPLPERAGAYLDMLGDLPGYAGQPYVTDKMPANYCFLGLIAAMLPEARIIHCRRDPIDTCVSNYTKLFTASQHWSYDLSTLASVYRDYWKLMEHWRSTLPGRFLELRYEDTVADVAGTARRLLDWCELPWHAGVENFHLTERSVSTASAHQVRQPIYTTSMGRWKKWEPYIDPLVDGLRDIEDAYWAEQAPA